MGPFEGVRIIDITHVLAGLFAAYQLAVLGADVFKVEHPQPGLGEHTDEILRGLGYTAPEIARQRRASAV